MLERRERLFQVGTILLPLIARVFAFYLLGRRNAASLGIFLSTRLAQLGGAYLALGAELSLRYDIFPAEFCDELSKIKRSAISFDSSVATGIIASELKRPIDELFSSFSENPIYTGPYGQTHTAVLKTGEPVLIKIQRPGARALVEFDLSTIAFVLRALSFTGFGGLPAALDYQGFRIRTLEKLSFTLEASRIQSLATQSERNFRECIPAVHWTYTTDHLLTTNRSQGVLLSELLLSTASPGAPAEAGEILYLQGYSLLHIAENVMHNQLNQILGGKYFIANLHADNLMVLKDNAIGYLDLGDTEKIDARFASYQFDFLDACRSADAEWLYEFFLQYFEIPFGMNLSHLEEAFRAQVAQCLEAFEGQHGPARTASLSALLRDCLSNCRRAQIRVPRTILACSRALTSSDNLLQAIAPDVNRKKVLSDFFRERLTQRVQRQFSFRNFSQLFLELESFLMSFPGRFRDAMRLIRRTQSPAVRTTNLWELRGWKYLRLATTLLFIVTPLAWLWSHLYSRSLSGKWGLFYSPGMFLGMLAILFVLQRVSCVGYSNSRRGHWEIRTP